MARDEPAGHASSVTARAGAPLEGSGRPGSEGGGDRVDGQNKTGCEGIQELRYPRSTESPGKTRRQRQTRSVVRRDCTEADERLNALKGRTRNESRP